MSYSGGWSTGSNGAPSFNFGNMIQQGAAGLNTLGGTVGTEKPEYEFPMGIERVPMDVQEMFLRGDAGPSRLNEFLQNADPKVIDRFRSAVNMGLIKPKNAAADSIIKGYGGLRAGDQVGPGGILGPMQDDMPSGLSPEYWQQANTLISTMIDAQMKAAEQSGYFNGMPTIQAEQIKGQLAQGWKQQFTNEFLANEQQRAAMAQEGLTQQEINNQNLQNMAKIMGGTVNPQTGQFQQTEEGRQFDTTASGWLNGQATLTREQQAFNQAKDVAALASNPRNYMEAQMLGGARGGLGGMAPNNQINATTGLQQGQQGLYGGPLPQGGQQPLGWQGLRSTQAPGVSGAGTLAQMGGPGMPGQDGQVQPAGQEEWARMYQQAQGAQDQARQAMLGAQQGPGAGAASALSPGPGSPGMVQPYAGYQGQAVQNMDGQMIPQLQQRMAAQPAQGFQPPQAGQMGQVGQGQPGGQQFTTSAFSQALLKNRMVPGSGGIQGQGQYMTGQQMQQALPNLNKIRGQDYLRGNTSERQGFNAVSSMAGFSDEDTLDAMQRNTQTGFKAPGAGRMI